MKEMLKMPKMKRNGDSGRRAHLAAHAAANLGRLPTRTRPETQQSGPHWPCHARVKICGPDKRICGSTASLVGVSEQNGWHREALVVLQPSPVTRRPARHPPRAPAPTCPVPSAGVASAGQKEQGASALLPREAAPAAVPGERRAAGTTVDNTEQAGFRTQHPCGRHCSVA